MKRALTRQEIEGTSGTNAFEIIQRLRPTFLSKRNISPSDIGEIRYYSASDAARKWGLGHTAGATQVIAR